MNEQIVWIIVTPFIVIAFFVTVTVLSLARLKKNSTQTREGKSDSSQKKPLMLSEILVVAIIIISGLYFWREKISVWASTLNSWVLWATVVILALVLYKILVRRKKASTVSWSLLGKSQPAPQSSSGSVTFILIILVTAAVAMDGFGISDTNFITTWRYGCTTQSELNAAPPIDQAGRVITLCNGVDENLFLIPIAGYSLEYQYSDQTKGDAADLLRNRQTQDFFSLNPPQNRGGVWLLIQNKSDTSGWKTSGLQTLKLAVRAGTRPTH